MKKITTLFLVSLSLAACHSGASSVEGTKSSSSSFHSMKNSTDFCRDLIPSEYFKSYTSRSTLDFNMNKTIMDVKRGLKVYIDNEPLTLEKIQQLDVTDPYYHVISTLHQGLLLDITAEIFQILGDSFYYIKPELMAGHLDMEVRFDTKSKTLLASVRALLEQQSCNFEKEKIIEHYEPYSPDGVIKYTLGVALTDDNIKGISTIVNKENIAWTSNRFTTYEEVVTNKVNNIRR